MKNLPLPLVALPACVKSWDGQNFHYLGDKYARSLAEVSGVLPLVIPSLGEELIDVGDLVARIDGLLMTGSPSNVHPSHYGEKASPEAEPFDPHRDATSLKLIREALRTGLPLLCICRGFQELNVALGGTLYPRVHEVDGRLDHRRPQSDDLDVQYGPNHSLRLVQGSAFATLFGTDTIEVNSLHWQAVKDLAPGLVAEGLAPDGTIEAVRVADAKGFALGVQWHPEYKAKENPISVKLFEAFGDAVREHAARRAKTSRAA